MRITKNKSLIFSFFISLKIFKIYFIRVIFKYEFVCNDIAVVIFYRDIKIVINRSLNQNIIPCFTKCLNYRTQRWNNPVVGKIYFFFISKLKSFSTNLAQHCNTHLVSSYIQNSMRSFFIILSIIFEAFKIHICNPHR